MKTVQQLFVCALLAALTGVAVSAIYLLRVATATVAALPGEAMAARQDLHQQLTSARRDLLLRTDRQLSGLRRDVMAEAEAIRQTSDRRMGDVLVRADQALESVDQLNRELRPVFQNTAAITAQVNGALPSFLDCDHNADCAFNRYVGASRGIERAALNFGQASNDFRGTLPHMLSTWEQVGANVSGTAANFERLTKPHWYDRLIGYGLNGIVIYRNLNPATNLTVKGAQAIAARP